MLKYFQFALKQYFFSVTMENIQEMMRDPNALVFSWTV